MRDLNKNLKLSTILSSSNLAEKLDEQDLEHIGQEICEGYHTDLLSRSNWEDKIEKWTELALQVAETKTFPWPGAANVKYPLITTAALQFSARSYAALMPGVNVVRGRVIGFDPMGEKLERSIRVGKHMSYQILEEMEDWEEEMDRLLFALPIVGCMFKKTYFDSVKGRNVSEIVYPKELVVNYWAKSLEESDRITHVLKMTENDVFERVSGGVYIDQDLDKSNSLAEERLGNKVSERAIGLDNPNDDETLPYLILEQCLYLDLDGDGYKEPYIATVNEADGKVLRLVARFDDRGVEYNERGNLLRINPNNYFTKFSFIPSPDGGFYDIGFGILLGPINETINTLINQLLDAGTLSNMQGGFMSKGIRIKGGNKQFQPGEWKYANTAGDDLRKGLVPLPVREPSQVLFSLLGMMIESGEKLSSVTEVMTGEIPGQNTKATVAMAAIEQGMKVFSSIYKRIHRSLAKEYKKLYKLNSIFLEEEAYFTVLDIGQEMQAQIGLRDYAGEDVDVVPASDPNVATEEQRLAKVQALFELLQMGTVNPQEVTKRYLEATEQSNIEALMQMPEPQPDPEVEREKQKMQMEHEHFQDESQRAWQELEIKKMSEQADAQLAMAKAQSEMQPKQLEDRSAENTLKQMDIETKRYGIDLTARIEMDKLRIAEENKMAMKRAELSLKEREIQRVEDEEADGPKQVIFNRENGRLVGASVLEEKPSGKVERKSIVFNRDGSQIIGATITDNTTEQTD